MFAGPNGSGKSKLFDNLALERSPLGVFHGGPFVNADELEMQWRDEGGIDLRPFGTKTSTAEIRTWMQHSDWAALVKVVAARMELSGSTLRLPRHTRRTYFAAALADYLREKLVAVSRSFSFETVMSHHSKVDFFARARLRGYKSYLYFVATDDPELNVQRVRVRKQAGGHPVPKDKIIKRYKRSLALLPAAVRVSDRAFLFDNSGTGHVLVAEVTAGKILTRHLPGEDEPAWFRRFLKAADYL